MKKPRISPLIVVTSLFLIFLSLLFVFRNTRRSPVLISSITPTSRSVPFAEPLAERELININTATVDELTSLPGIGETIAQRIIDYRNTHGRFQSEDQLLNVDGIGSGKLMTILHLITLGGN